MKVLQLIDSLEAGGAERVAVTYANKLASVIDGSFLCATRKEGILKDTIDSKVRYTFLERKRTLDMKALFKIRAIVKENKIDIVHAHTTSYFFATLLKLTYPKLTLIWHEHQGNRIASSRSSNKMLYLCSYFFQKIIAVNNELKNWCSENLATKEVVYLSNFVDAHDFENNKTISKNIVCLANLKAPKNHLNLLQAFMQVHESFPDWKMVLAGKDFEDDYSNRVKRYISENSLSDKVTVLGAISDVKPLLLDASIGVLSSDSEGLPMALLEYGASGLAVVTTNVGECASVIGEMGTTVPIKNADAMDEAIKAYITDTDLLEAHSKGIRERIINNYSMETVLPRLISIYKN